MPPRILIIDDEPSVRFGIRDFLESTGYEVDEADSVQRGREALRTGRPDVAIVDYRLPDGNALDLLREGQENGAAAVPLIILTAHGSIDLAVQAVKEGAEHFLTKPLELPTLAVILNRVIEQQRSRQNELARRSRASREEVNPFAGTSPALRTLEDQALRVAAASSPVLIRGETGTGKGVLARWLHLHSPRALEPFVDLNCATLSRDFLETELFGHERGAFTGAVTAKTGLLEVAHRGTLFLDEIGDMDLEVQPKLLKVLEEKRFRRMGDVRDRRVDVRLLVATHHDLGALVHDRKFRQDLYFRISTVPLMVPALRERREDIPGLARELLDHCAADVGRRHLSLAADAVAALCDYSWPGNIRELRNVLERAVLLTDAAVLTEPDLRFDMASPAPVLSDTRLTLVALEQRYITEVLREEQGHVERSAVRLGIPRSSLYQKIKRYGIAAAKDQGGPRTEA
ncbi:MAG: sigma-54 dependent transcriptional regulator [Acidobacteriota bacterium]|nr:sigma-54 dependent transcriptional regulator [Acidobacteriota bacterium]